ncbi:UBX domain-containing protein 1 [Yarrowia sp. B02]|nr:UBX domain-containing protein 1 [Yarrowia sp. B02]
MVSEEEKTERIAQFVGITQSSPEDAHDCLLHTDWDVPQAVDLFLSSNDVEEEEEDDEAEDVEDDSDAYANPSGIAPSGIAAGIQGFLSGLAGRDDQPEPILDTTNQQPSGYRLGDGTGSSTPVGGSGATSASGSGSTPGPGPTPSTSNPPRRGVAGVRTLGDLSRDNAPPKRQDLFTGGEKSALAVQNPNRPGQGNQGNPLVNDIIRRAEANPARPRGDDDESEDEEVGSFHGTGFTLGSDEVQSRPVESAVPTSLPKVSRSITFWQNGFTVEDGPLYRYDDPRNQRYLETLNQGRAPLALLDVQHNQAVDINVTDRSEEAYVEKKPVYGGSGNRLGSPVPGDSPAVSTPAVSTPVASSSASGPSNSASGAGGSRIQIRLGDGTRLTPSFSPDLTVQALYDFVDEHNPSGRAYVLQTTFPNKELRDKSLTLKDAQVIGAAIVQRYE